MLNRFLVSSIAIIAFITDRATKSYLPADKLYNSGAAFGILEGKTAFLSVFSVLVLAFLVVYTVKNAKTSGIIQKIGLGMVMGGTAGNLYDRISYGHVIDFIRLGFIDFPVFNGADVFINIGVILLLMHYLIK